jgi:hypothetical protein
MRTRLAPLALLLAAALAPPPVHAEPKASDQTVLVRVRALDDLIADLMYLAETAGQKDKAEEYEKLLKSLTGDDGLKGIDLKKPFGFYAKVLTDVQNSPVVAMLPIADEKAFLDLLKKVNLDPTKDGDHYSLSPVGLPVTIYFRFANGYAYVTALDADHIDKDKLLSPAEALPPTEIGLASVVFNIDQIPDTFKKLAVANVGQGLAQAKKNGPPGETDAQKKFRIAALDEIGDYVKSAINDGATALLRLDVDRKTADLGATMTMSAKSGSKLATGITNLGSGKSVGASVIGADSAANVALNVALPEGLRKYLGPAVDEGIGKILEQETRKEARDVGEKMLKALAPSLKAATLDFGATIDGAAVGKYVGVFAFRLKEGGDVDKALRDAAKELPAKDRDKVKFDFAKAGSVAIHRVDLDDVDAKTKEALGDDPHLYFAVRDDALLATLGGDKALAALKDAVGREPKAGRIFQAEASILRLAPLMAREQKGAVEAAKKAFGDKKDSDKVTFTIDGGKLLKIHVGAKAQIVKFGALMEAAGAKDQ